MLRQLEGVHRAAHLWTGAKGSSRAPLGEQLRSARRTGPMSRLTLSRRHSEGDRR